MNEEIIDFSLVKRANEEQTPMYTLRDTSKKYIKILKSHYKNTKCPNEVSHKNSICSADHRNINASSFFLF